MSEKKKTMRAVIEIIIAVLVIIAVYFIIRGMDRHDVRIQQAATENETQRVWKEFQEKTVSIKLHKKTWKFAHPVQTYLFIGTDKSGNEDAEGEEYHGSMADALMLVVVDKEEKTYGILQLNRDTITEVPMLLQDGSANASAQMQLCTAHWYGKDKAASCDNTVETVSQEIQTEYYGEGLNGLLSARHFDMQGIVNGIDYTTYNPQTDSKIYMNYDASNFRKKKYVNKERLQEELGLEVDKKKYMIGLISRLTDQKGLDLINAVMDGLVDEFTQLVVIGTGEPQYENMFRHYAWKYPNRVSANICYSDDLAHKLYAAADAFLMPSRFEPCGLTQMISFRYGTVPIVRETGGLKDTVQAYNEYDNSGDGFSFTNYNADEMLQVINYSKHIFYDRKRQWNQMVDRGMANDFSWNASKFRYEGLYNYLLGE